MRAVPLAPGHDCGPAAAALRSGDASPAPPESEPRPAASRPTGPGRHLYVGGRQTPDAAAGGGKAHCGPPRRASSPAYSRGDWGGGGGSGPTRCDWTARGAEERTTQRRACAPPDQLTLPETHSLHERAPVGARALTCVRHGQRNGACARRPSRVHLQQALYHSTRGREHGAGRCGPRTGLPDCWKSGQQHRPRPRQAGDCCSAAAVPHAPHRAGHDTRPPRALIPAGSGAPHRSVAAAAAATATAAYDARTQASSPAG
jgi:hypothetical protein